MKLQPYLFFEGRCEEAIEFYKKAIGAKVEFMMRYKDAPVPPQPDSAVPIPGEKILHATIRVGENIFLASDGHSSGKPDFKGFSLAITAANPAEAEKLFTALAAGGQVQMPLTKTFFSPSFGMATDQFGVGWMVMVGQ